MSSGGAASVTVANGTITWLEGVEVSASAERYFKKTL
jgi:hypothetical protein